MKKNLSLATLFFLLGSNYALGAAVVKAKVIGSEAKLNVGSVSGASSRLGLDESAQSAFGGGADLEFLLGSPLRLGVGFGLTKFDDKDKNTYSNTVFNGYGTYDLLNQDVFALYGKAGLSYHQLSFDNRNVGPVQVSYDDTGILNYDLGVGSRFKLNENLNFALEYNFTDTFSRSDVDVREQGLGLVATQASLKNVSLRSNEFVASLGYAF